MQCSNEILSDMVSRIDLKIGYPRFSDLSASKELKQKILTLELSHNIIQVKNHLLLLTFFLETVFLFFLFKITLSQFFL